MGEPERSMRSDGATKGGARGQSVRSGGVMSSKLKSKMKRLTLAQFFHLMRRLLIIAAAVWYAITSIEASIASVKVLRGSKNAQMKFEAYDTNNILGAIGNGSIHDSPLVTQMLGNDLSLRPYTIYLEGDGKFSTVNCSTPKFHARMYSDFFLRLAVGALMRDVYYNITEFMTHQILVPIIDCSFTPLVRGDDTVIRVYYLMKHRVIPNDIFLLATRFSMQDYRIDDQNEVGPAGVVTYQLIRDMRITDNPTHTAGAFGLPFESISISSVFEPQGFDKEGWWVLKTLPKNPLAEASKRFVTASRTGFYVSSDSEQCNIKNLYWSINDDPVTSLTKWNWKGEPVLKDSWAWVHFLHVGFAIDATINLVLLFLVIYRNLEKGKIWIGDAFVSISTTLMVRGVMILISWIINGFWSLMEFCLHDAHALAQTQEIFFHPSMMRADLMTLYLAVATAVGYLTRERIDPALVMIVFEIVFNCRLDIVRLFPRALTTITEFAEMDQKMAVLGVSKMVAFSSPLRLWTTHKLPAKDPKFIFSCLFPIFSSIGFILLYVALRKVWHRMFPAKVHKMDSKNTAPVSDGDEHASLYKRSLTLFEIATGAELQNRYGVVSDYENCIYIKGMKYASADGIYCNGFVIANGKFLIAAVDVPTIIILKLTRVRLQNVFIYAVEGSTVQQTAKLVYPHTLSWSDLFHLNVAILS